MERILGILKDAETITSKERHGLESFKARYHTSLGSEVLNYSIIRVLSEIEIVDKLEQFKDATPEETVNMFQQYVTLLTSAYKDTIDTSTSSVEQIGRLFGEDPQSTLRFLRSTIWSLRRTIVKGMTMEQEKKRFQFDFPAVWFFQPFREASFDPLVLDLRLGMKNHPLNLLLVSLDDKDVWKEFLKRSQSKVSLDRLQRFLIIQELEGKEAFKIAAKLYLQSVDPGRTIHSPFEGYHNDISDADTESDIEMVKAIAAGRSQFMRRLHNYRDYKIALTKLDPSKWDTNQKIVELTSRMFDRFFGASFRNDSNTCFSWVEHFIEFYLENQQNEQYFESVFHDSMETFSQACLSANADTKLFFLKRKEEAAARKVRAAGAERKRKSAPKRQFTFLELFGDLRKPTDSLKSTSSHE